MVSQTSLPGDTPQIPDPWVVAQPPPTPPHPWHFEPDAHPLIAASAPPDGLLMQEGVPNAPQLPPPEDQAEAEAATILVQEELKLRSSKDPLWNKIRDALALLLCQPRAG